MNKEQLSNNSAPSAVLAVLFITAVTLFVVYLAFKVKQEDERKAEINSIAMCFDGNLYVKDMSSGVMSPKYENGRVLKCK